MDSGPASRRRVLLQVLRVSREAQRFARRRVARQGQRSLLRGEQTWEIVNVFLLNSRVCVGVCVCVSVCVCECVCVCVCVALCQE